ncbi:MAG: iron ABC transporter permease, partial [Clostridia bacterium]|nr:iron ABC transporter permease [Clostridia bacterium]
MAKKGWKRPKMTGKRFKNQLLSVIGNPFNMIVFFTLILLFITIIIPLLSMVQNTFVVAKSELRNIPGAKVGDYTLWYWKYLLASPLTKTILWVPLRNSLIIGAFVTVISVPLGALMAWLMVRTDIPAKGLLSALILIPYMIPSWCKALSWMTIFRNPSMGGNGVLSSLGIPVPDALASGFIPIILVMTLHYYAFSYIMASGALRSINSELEEMGEIQGASKAQILKSITLPLILPSILSATIMTISKSIGTYGVAARLGGNNPDGTPFYVLATRMKDF